MRHLTKNTCRLITTASVVVLAACNDPVDRPPVKNEQYGFRGTGMQQVVNPRAAELIAALNQLPEPIYEVPADDGGPRATEVYENVQVLTDLSSDQFDHLMAQITEWVAPEQGCTYCHSEDGNFADDSVYTKTVARKMIQMTWEINANWQDHVNGAGVNCYTCHRGQNIPANYWVKDKIAQPDLGWDNGQNHPGVGLTSMRADPFTPYLQGDREIRVNSLDALPTEESQQVGTQDAELTYALMIHFSQSLGVNCTFCHNTRAVHEWDGNPPQRVTAWYGIRMVRQINNGYMTPLTSVFPDHRKGPHGDVFKVGCSTCHQGINKPLYGVNAVVDTPQLSGGKDYSAAAALPVAASGDE